MNNNSLQTTSKRLLVSLVATALASLVPHQAQAAVPLLSGFGGPTGYGTGLPANDDGSLGPLNLPFQINFYGNTFSQFYLNNNGNITFQSGLSTYTPNAFPGASQPIIAPWWADVDTRNPASSLAYYASPNPDALVLTWPSVGYFSAKADKLNSFQMILKNRADTGTGNFDIEYRYAQLEWDAGDFSGGVNGIWDPSLSGSAAVAGFDAGDGTNYFNLPGSGTNEVLNIVNLSNVSPQTPGLWEFAVRNGELPGGTPDNPLLPVVIDNQWNFQFNIPNVTHPIFIDPPVTVGYNYIVDSGPDITSVVLPTGIGDNLYELWSGDTSCTNFANSGTTLTGGNSFTFAPSVRCFGVRGIETSAMLDPNNTTAFVTGLTFAQQGVVSMRMIPLTQDVNGGVVTVPEPTVPIWVYAGLAGLGLLYRRRW